MNEPIENYSDYSLPVSAYRFCDKAVALPLASARNYAAELASCEVLIFLDADCIPDRKLVGTYRLSAQKHAIALGDVYYLNEADSQRPFNSALFKNASSHPHRRLRDMKTVPHELFWSLNFSCLKATFEDIGGFDSSFKGYGAEDTDFAFTARAKNISMVYADANVYHQYHPTYHPPLQHLEAIVNNARRFFEKWGVWPMLDWLQEFESLGLIQLHNDQISINRLPERHEIESAFNTDRSGY
ncbi:MAG: glycosyltransferase [Mucilaginibacter polytrichastri]|nr:glycosyltransferase [Mucilaginibacter polytrichastri]